MSPNGKLWTVAIAAGVIGALVGGGMTWGLLQQPTQTPTPVETPQLTALQTQIDQKDLEIESLTQRLNALVASASVTPTKAVEPPAAAGPVKQFTFVTKVATSGGKTSVTADYAQFLTGKAAAAAATAAGDESPPPNDYYIVNDNKQLRTLPVKAGISVKLTARDDGTSEPEGYTVSLADWAKYYVSPTEDARSITEGPYWFTITDGVVTAIAEQYTP